MLDTQTGFLISLFVLLACALLAGELALRLGQLALVGQLVVGVVLGPSLLGPYLGLTTVSPALGAVQLLATFFLLFLAGLERHPSEIYRIPLSTVLLGLCLFLLPGILTFSVVEAVFPGIGTIPALFLAVTLSITALPVMAVMVSEFGLGGREFGRVIMTASLVNELAAVTAFAVLLQINDVGPQAKGIPLFTALGSTGLFLGVVAAAYLLLQYVRQHRTWTAATDAIARSVRSREAGFALLMVLSIGAALLSEYLGLTFVIGAFYAGVLVTPESVGTRTYENLRSVLYVITWGFFLPLFFAVTGLEIDLHVLLSTPAATAFLALVLVAIVAKVGVGAGLVRLQRWSTPDSLALGFLANSRGAVEIAMAVILYTNGILNLLFFTVVVAVGLLCTIIAPIGAVLAWKSTPESRADLYERVPSLAVRSVILAPRQPTDEPGAAAGTASRGLRVTFSPPPGADGETRVIDIGSGRSASVPDGSGSSDPHGPDRAGTPVRPAKKRGP